ncbi:temptin-like [Argopecten irradians]|uniref:temptin-like n=1 Tax=Argopecten irradians TaxID=31199 RepID=UPI0037138FF5
MTKLYSLITIVCVGFGIIMCHPQFYSLVPNSMKVPYTCPGAGPNDTFPRIGHWPNLFERNPFGKSFSHNWTEICDLDPDNDNRTSGEELGDPGCQWIQNDVSTHKYIIEAASNPGIPEVLIDGKYVVMDEFRDRACPVVFFLF